MQKVISKRHAIELIRQGKAKSGTRLKPDDNGYVYKVLDRYDTQETCHYLDHIEL